MLFFQAPLIPELLIMAFDLESMEKLIKMIKNNKQTEEDVEAYKYNFSHKGEVHKVWLPLCENMTSGITTRSDTNQAVQLRKIARGLEF